MKWTNNILGFAAMIFLVVLITSIATALALPPTVTIVASPNPAQTSSTITAVAVDLSGTGIAWTRIFENGVKVKECSTSVCVYVAVHTTPGVRTYYATTSDNGGRTATSSTINVNFENSAPVLNYIGDRVVDEGSLLEFTISGYDYNNDTLTYSASGIPSGATFDAVTRTFSWTPGAGQVGTWNVNFSVSDGTLSDSEVIVITVNPLIVNHAPVLDAIGDKDVEVGELLEFTINASDIDGDALTYSTSMLPPGATFDAVTRIFSWTPADGQNGTYNVNFSVSDGTLSDSEVVTIDVLEIVVDTEGPIFNWVGWGVEEHGGVRWFTTDVSVYDPSNISAVWINFNGTIYSDVQFVHDEDELDELVIAGEPFLAYFAPPNASDYTEESLLEFIFLMPNITVGNYSYEWFANDTLGNINSRDLEFEFVDDVPQYSNIVESPSDPATYAPNQYYEFNITWTDYDYGADPRLEFNGDYFYPYDLEYFESLNASEIDEIINSEGGILVDYGLSYSMSVYSFKTKNLSVGVYNYTWDARDWAGNVNDTGILTYTVQKATPVLTISMLPSDNVANNTETNVTGTGCPAELNGTCKLYRDGIEVNNSDIQNLSAGVYNYIYNTTGNANYNASSVSATLRVGQGSGDDDDEESGGGSSDTITVSDNNLAKGYYTYLDIGDKLKFNFCGAPYYIKLSDIDDDKAYFKITPGETTLILDEYEKEEIDLDSNGIKDIVFRVESLSSSRAKVYIKRISSICGSQNVPEQVVSTFGTIEKLSPEKEQSNVLAISLMIGIFFAALAIIAIIISRLKK
jgi:hypothetical protein